MASLNWRNQLLRSLQSLGKSQPITYSRCAVAAPYLGPRGRGMKSGRLLSRSSCVWRGEEELSGNQAAGIFPREVWKLLLKVLRLLVQRAQPGIRAFACRRREGHKLHFLQPSAPGVGGCEALPTWARRPQPPSHSHPLGSEGRGGV